MTGRIGAVLALLVVALGTLGGCGTTPDDTSGEGARDSTPAAVSPTTTPPTTAVPPTTSAAPTDAPTTDAGPATSAADRWRPAPGASWQYQLSGTLDTTVTADVVDADWQETTAAQVAAVHARGGRMVCYVNAGAYEDWRPDADAYPAAVLGDPLDGWPGERWLDVRRAEVVLPLVAARMDVCRSKGFDAVETDNVDGWANDTGFDLTGADQLAFNRALADLAHARGLSIALKNDVEQVPDLVEAFDFAVNEECWAYDECDAYRAFTAAGKAVLNVEYGGLGPEICAGSATLGLSTIGKDLDLGPGLQSC